MSSTETLEPLMTRGRRLVRMAMMAGLATFAVACADTPEPEPMDDDPAPAETMDDTQMTSTNTLVDVASEAGDFTTLLAAVSAAGLTETLEGDGPFTVFAPTDEAFDNLPDGALDELLADTDALADVLLYHVVPGMVMSDEVVNSDQLTSAQGGYLDVEAGDDGVTVGGANVVSVDIQADNGVIHVIDAVLLPGN